MLSYPVEIKTDGNGYLATFRDIPEAITGGSDRAALIKAAKDALITALDFYFEDKRVIPNPTKPTGDDILVELPLSIELKIILLNEMLSKNVRQIDLAKAMGINRQEITRIVNLRHSTKVDSLVSALNTLGKKVEIRVI